MCAASGPESPAAGTRHGLPHAIIAWLALQPLSIRLRARMAGLEGKLALALRLMFTMVYGGNWSQSKRWNSSIEVTCSSAAMLLSCLPSFQRGSALQPSSHMTALQCPTVISLLYDVNATCQTPIIEDGDMAPFPPLYVSVSAKMRLYVVYTSIHTPIRAKRQLNSTVTRHRNGMQHVYCTVLGMSYVQYSTLQTL